MDRRKLKKVLAGLGITGLIASTALAGTITVRKKTIPIERIPVQGYSDQVGGNALSNATIKLDGGITAGSKIKFTLENGNFTGGSQVQICAADGSVLGNGQVTAGGNNTVEVTLLGNLTTQTYYILSGNADNNNNCTGLPIRVQGGLNVGDKVSISGEVPGIGDIISSADLYEIGQQFNAIAETQISYIDLEDLKRFTNAPFGRFSDAKLYLQNSTVSWPLRTNGTNTITVSVSGDDWTGVKSDGVTYCGNRLSNSTKEPKVFSNSNIPVDGNNALSSFCTLSIEVTGDTVLTPREFKTTVKGNNGNDFRRDMVYLKDFVTHRWEYGGTAFYIPFVRHNVAQNAFTTIKIQAATSTLGSTYTVSAQVLKSDGSWAAVSMPCQVDGTPTSTLTAGKTCVITGDVLTAAAGKEETMAKILITAPEDNVSCYAVYDIQGKSRRVPCKVNRGGFIIE